MCAEKCVWSGFEIKIAASEVFHSTPHFYKEDNQLETKYVLFRLSGFLLKTCYQRDIKIIVLLKLHEIRLIFHLLYTFPWLLFRLLASVRCMHSGNKTKGNTER